MAQVVGASFRETPGTPEWNAAVVGVQAESMDVDYKNYKQKICYPDLFVVTQPSPDGFTYNSDGHVISTEISSQKKCMITTTYDAYCYSKPKYDEAVEAIKNKGDDISVGDKVDLDSIILKNGIVLATACEMLKRDKKNSEGSFVGIFQNTKPCDISPSSCARRLR